MQFNPSLPEWAQPLFKEDELGISHPIQGGQIHAVSLSKSSIIGMSFPTCP